MKDGGTMYRAPTGKNGTIYNKRPSGEWRYSPTVLTRLFLDRWLGLEHLAVAQNEFLAAPLDAVGGESRQPDGEIDQIAEWDKPELTPEDVVPKTPNTGDPSHGQAQNEIRGKVGSAD